MMGKEERLLQLFTLLSRPTVAPQGQRWVGCSALEALSSLVLFPPEGPGLLSHFSQTCRQMDFSARSTSDSGEKNQKGYSCSTPSVSTSWLHGPHACTLPEERAG